MKKLVVAICAIAAFTSCDKNDDEGAPPRTSLLTSGSWKVTAATAVVEAPPPVGTQNIDVYATYMENCQKDNTYKFNADKTTTLNEGATKCTSTDSQTASAGNWDLYNNNTKFKMTLQGFPIDADVVAINSTTLSIKYDTTMLGFSAIVNTTFTHIP